jgi:dihydrolipoamide dehydrogenase
MAPNSTYDVIIVGSGPGGYMAAARAAQLGLKVACIEKAPRLGGVCLNVGCIPSKALLDSSEYFQLAKNQFADHGIKTGRLSLDLAVMMARKEKVVQDLTENVKRLLEGNKVEIIQGTARLAAADQITVESDSGSSKKKQRATLSAKAIILATGSETVPLPNLPFDGQQIISCTQTPGYRRRRLYRAGAGVGLAAAGRQGESV